MLSSARIEERLARRTLALVLAGGRGSRLKQLTDRRAKPAATAVTGIAISRHRLEGNPQRKLRYPHLDSTPGNN